MWPIYKFREIFFIIKFAVQSYVEYIWIDDILDHIMNLGCLINNIINNLSKIKSKQNAS